MRSVLRAFAPSSLFLFLATNIAACGSYSTTKIKDYRMHVVNGTPEQVATFNELIADFNHFAGEEVLRYTDQPEDANSPITLEKGLKANSDGHNKIGYGQWLTTSQQEDPISAIGRSPKRTIKYSMSIRLDLDFFASEHASRSDDDTYARQKLFFHEVGHGLELDHVADKSNVMNESIDGDKDFDGFFRYVRKYMSDT